MNQNVIFAQNQNNAANTSVPHTPDTLILEKAPTPKHFHSENLQLTDKNMPDVQEEERQFKAFIKSRLPKHKASQGLLKKIMDIVNH